MGPWNSPPMFTAATNDERLTLVTAIQTAKQSELAEQNKRQEQFEKPEANLEAINRHLSVKSHDHKTPEARRENARAKRDKLQPAQGHTARKTNQKYCSSCGKEPISSRDESSPTGAYERSYTRRHSENRWASNPVTGFVSNWREKRAGQLQLP
ncbi:hypothetical protein KIL84_020087 [Mauremys mutica]|uniref:Uncharacterized protein n=1 Tax=Mauremys mutica TaxID=74926 RepID=A0A9D3XW56_9SAUR|nr:hypothetical protein KIL84_020087 [Mauremys mutica]